MKNVIKLICFVSVCAASTVVTRELPEGVEERLQEIEKECCNVVDEILLNARQAALDKENMLNPEWLKKQPINGIRNRFSDALIISFDNNEPYIMSEKIEAYVHKKARKEFLYAMADGADIDGLKEFLWVSRMLCELSHGADCRGMTRAITRDHKGAIAALKAEKEARLQAAHLARENILIGAAERD